MLRIVSTIALLISCAQAHSGEADVIGYKVAPGAQGTFKFDVTVVHADAGWSHYADKWEVVGPNGVVYATRVLGHPHDDEQPFMRSLDGIKIPDDIKQITIRAHDLQHAYGGNEMIVDLPGR